MFIATMPPRCHVDQSMCGYSHCTVVRLESGKKRLFPLAHSGTACVVGGVGEVNRPLFEADKQHRDFEILLRWEFEDTSSLVAVEVESNLIDTQDALVDEMVVERTLLVVVGVEDGQEHASAAAHELVVDGPLAAASFDPVAACAAVLEPPTHT